MANIRFHYEECGIEHPNIPVQESVTFTAVMASSTTTLKSE
jgi:hypothetical protein